MSDLYTSAVHLKRLLEGRATAPFTPAPEAVLKVLDPSFFPGMGAVNENSQGLLQCPVRGCGKFYVELATHLSRSHRGLGGADGVRSALGIPKRIALTGSRGSPKKIGKASVFTRDKELHRRALAKAALHRVPRPKGSPHLRNVLDSCPAQIQEKIKALAEKLGRTPSERDFTQEYGGGLRDAINQTFGSWIGAKAAVGLTANRSGSPEVPRRLVVEMLRSWVEAHGDLPSANECTSRKETPYIPSFKTILDAFGVASWTAAMRSAVQELSLSKSSYLFGQERTRNGAGSKDPVLRNERLEKFRASLIADLTRAAALLGRTPNSSDMARLCGVTWKHDQLRTYFGSVAEAYRVAGLHAPRGRSHKRKSE